MHTHVRTHMDMHMAMHVGMRMSMHMDMHPRQMGTMSTNIDGIMQLAQSSALSASQS